MKEPKSLLSTQALTIGYADRIVAQSLRLNLGQGQLVCLLGPNGAGKSTLMRTLAGLQPPLSGHILIGELTTTQLPPSELARLMSVVLAERIDVENLLVVELVALGRTPHTGWLGKLTSIDHQKIQNALLTTNTIQFAHRRLHQLSDGERQKVMLARALAQDTDLILLDEPTAHLDLPNRVDMMRLLHRLTRQNNKAILLSTHELDLALQTADQLWLLDPAGQLATGTPEDLVLNGSFESTFARGGFDFNKSTGTFTMHKEETGPAINLTGDEGLIFWTHRALQREGFSVTSLPDALCIITASFHKGIPLWHWEFDGQSHECVSIQALLQTLQVLKSQSINIVDKIK